MDLSGYDEPDDETEARRPARRPLRRSQAPDPEEQPRGRRHHQGSRDEDEVRERPARGRTRPRPVDEDQYEDNDEDYDERPARGRRGRGRDRDEEEPRPKVDTSGGFARFKSERAKSGGFPDSFKPEPKETYLIKFLEDEPFSVYGQHWIDEIKDGRRSFMCLEEDCPLCDMLGHKPRAMALFNIVVYEEVKRGRQYDLVPTYKMWECGPQIGGILGALDEELKDAGKSGLADGYVTVRKTTTGSGRGAKVTWSIHALKERDLEDEWEGVEPLTDEDLEEFEQDMKDDSLMRPDSRATLKEIVREVQKLDD